MAALEPTEPTEDSISGARAEQLEVEMLLLEELQRLEQKYGVHVAGVELLYTQQAGFVPRVAGVKVRVEL